MVELTEDVLLTILDCIENRSMLHPLLLVSRWFHTAVEPRLYSSIELKTTNPVILRRRFDGLRRRIVSNQYLASRVRKLHIILGNAPGSPEQFSQLDDTLRYLVGLKDFKLNLYIPPGATLTTMTKSAMSICAHQVLVAESNARRRKVNCLNLNLESPFPVHLFQAMEDALGHIQFLNCFTRKTTFILPGICFMHNLRWLRLSFPLGIQQINLLDDIRHLLQVITERTTHLAYIQFPAWGTLKDLERQILQSVPPSCLVDIEGRQGGVFNRYYAGKQISLVFEGVSPTSATWWWTEDKLQRVLGKSPQALADPPRLAHLSPTLRDRTAASTLANFRSSATQPIVSLFSFVMVTKPSGRPTPLSHFPGQATDEPTSNHRWSEVIPPDTGLTFAVIWDPEDGLLAFSGAELLGTLDGQSQVITLKTLSSGNVLTETPATLAFFRDTHRFLFAGSRSRLSSAKRPRHGARTQTSSTIGGMDVYLRGSLLGRAHKDQTHYSCFDLLEQDFEVKPFNDLTKTDSTESLEMRYNRAFSIFQAEHNLSSRFSTTTTSTSSYISVKRNVGDEDFASKTWSILERPNTPIFSRPTLAHNECPNTDCGGVCVRASQRLRKYRRKRVDDLDIPTPPAEVLQRSEYNHEVNFPTPDCQRVTTPITLLRGLSNRWKKGHTCTY
ncbi:hypothetical protein EYR40_009482 [Pleurotus pulmonarius]|nr:hypothetical protein EYR40_009482 [Pleurotus pulmonarius]